MSNHETRNHSQARTPVLGCVILLFSALILVLLGGPRSGSAQQPQGVSALQGQVVDVASGQGIDGASLILEGTELVAVTDRRGRFVFQRVPPGEHRIRVERLGYEPRVESVSLADGLLVEVTVLLAVEAIPLEEIEVNTRSLLLERQGFYDRQRQGFRGFFMDRVAIEQRDPLYVADLFRSVPGVSVEGGSRLRMSQSVTLQEGGRGCEPSLWLDGVRSGLRDYSYIRPDHLEGVEVYTGGGAPGKYNDLCGTVVIWTRVPMRRR